MICDKNQINKSIFGASPENWSVDRIRDRLEAIVGGEWGDDPDAHDEGIEIPVIRVADIRGLEIGTENLTIRRVKESKLANRLIGDKTILIEKSGGGELQPVGRAALVRHITSPAICSNFMAKTDCGVALNPSFAAYLLNALYSCGINKAHIQQTTGIQNLRVTDYLNSKIAFPPLPEQERIAAFLDLSCNAIDTALVAKTKQINTLISLRKTIIQSAVTEGLNKSATFKSLSDQGCIAIPSHWKTDRMKDVVLLRNEKTDVGSDDMDYLELEDIEQGTGRIINKKDTLEVESAVTLFKKGDVLFGKLRAYLEKYYLADFDGKCTGEILAFKAEGILNRYLLYCVASPWFIGLCNMFSYGAKMPRVNWQTQLAQINLPIPPLSEQIEICDYLDREISELWALKAVIEKQIDVLNEYRKSLIHECVTGQRRITEADLARVQAHV